MTVERERNPNATQTRAARALEIVRRFPVDVELAHEMGAAECLRLGVLPWRRVGQTIFWACPNDEKLPEIATAFAHLPLRHRAVLVSTDWIDEMSARLLAPRLINAARDHCHANMSLRTVHFGDTRMFLTGLVLTLIAGGLMAPRLILAILLGLASLAILFTSALRLLAIFQFLRRGRRPKTPDLPIRDEWPLISILVPLFREPHMIGNLARNLGALNYPPSQLEIKIVLEADDLATIKAAEALDLPAHFEIIRVPIDKLRTKPKAMNYALPFCRGEYVGIYDAEDAPDPYQLHHVIEAFQCADDKVAAVQCQLAFYNSDQNFLTRAFTIEYRIWFHMILPTLQWLGMPVPLGGTSVFFRAEHLRKVGAWDAYNVTEDADLGVRLARFGYRTHVVTVETLEEANPRIISWVRQRSRWLKGYVVSWIGHMRHPFALWREMGTVGFLGVQLLFLGGITSYLSLPIFWLMWLNLFNHDFLGLRTLQPWLQAGFLAVALGAMSITLTLNVLALSARGFKRLIPWSFLMIFYWPLGAVAAYKAMIEIVINPFYWDKTHHGAARRFNRFTHRR